MPKARSVNPDKASYRDYLSIRAVAHMNEHARDGHYLYYAKPYYDHYDHGTGILLLSYRIRKETDCFYLLECGMRTSKKLDKRSFGTTPHDAACYCITRTQNYFDILFARAKKVQLFLKSVDCMRGTGAKNVRELQIFEELAKRFADPDDIPVELFRDFNLNSEMRIGDILR